MWNGTIPSGIHLECGDRVNYCKSWTIHMESLSVFPLFGGHWVGWALWMGQTSFTLAAHSDHESIVESLCFQEEHRTPVLSLTATARFSPSFSAPLPTIDIFESEISMNLTLSYILHTIIILLEPLCCCQQGQEKGCGTGRA